MAKNGSFDWFLRFVKGMFIGAGFILPGVSGGALAAAFGLYERMISFLAHLSVDFVKNFLFFFPVGLGGLAGIFLLSFPVSYFLETAEAEVLWFFIGCIIGVLPPLFKEAAKKGKSTRHTVIMLLTAAFGFLFLNNMRHLIDGSVPLNAFTWLAAGGIIGLGMIVPGLSPSNFLVYLNMYKPMTDGIGSLDPTIIVGLGVGAAITVLALSKLINKIFQAAYTAFYHVILGVVLASTIMIVPRNADYTIRTIAVCVLCCLAGILLGLWMNRLEEKYK